MNLKLMDKELQELLKANEKNKKVFTSEISVRFSDCIYGHQLHFSKIFEFFEMARFEIMEEFYTFYQEKKKSDKKINLGSFVVVRVQSEIHEALKKESTEDIQVKTNLLVRHKPMFEFKQIAKRQGEKIVEAKVKVVLVDEKMNKVENWDLDVLKAILEFVDQKGKEEKQ